jgi:type I restriction enzyme S subunit
MNVPYELQDGWHWETLEGLADVRTGVAKGRALGKADTVRVPYLRVANVQNGYLDLREIKTIEIRRSEIGRYSLRPNDILFTEGGDRDKLGRGAVWHGEITDCVHQNHVFAARLDTAGVLPEWVSLASQAQYARDYFMDVAHQTVNLASINATNLRALPVPVPPLEEQQRILASMDRMRGERRAAINALESTASLVRRFRQSVLAAAFRGALTARDPNDEPAADLLQQIRAERRADGMVAKIGTSDEIVAPDMRTLPNLPKGWAWTKFEDVLTELKNGYFAKAPDLEPPGIPILRISAVRPRSVSFEELRYLRGEDISRTTSYYLRNGDLLFTRYNGSLDLVGVCGMVKNLGSTVIYPDKLIRVRVVEKYIEPSYLEMYFSTRIPRRIVEERAKSSAGQQGISGKDLRAIPIALAPVEEQRRIVARVTELFRLADVIEQAIDVGWWRADKVDQAILERAFRGEL